jgi:hypothetical protein
MPFRTAVPACGRSAFLWLMAAWILLPFLGSCSVARPMPALEIPDRPAISAHLDRTFASFDFEDEFSSILSTLMMSSWDESGDWKGDLQGDATAFAPMLLLPMAHDSGDLRLRAMGDRTVRYEAGLVRRSLYWPFPSMSLVIGVPALAQPYLAEGDQEYVPLFLRTVRLGYLSASITPLFITPFVRDRASVYGLVGYMCFIASDVAQTPDDRDEFIQKGLRMVRKADEECFDPGEGLYRHSEITDWPQEVMVMAHARAYRATGDKAHLERAQLVLQSMDKRFLEAGRGGYAGHGDEGTKGLSGNNNMTSAFLDLYEATGDGQYLRKARAVLSWILSDDLYDRQKGIICHHVTRDRERAGYFCTGCNFETLACIYRYNRLVTGITPTGFSPALPALQEKNGRDEPASQQMQTNEQNRAIDTP